jgi:hypothetical protein
MAPRWPSVATTASLPNVSGSPTQSSYLEVGDECYVTGTSTLYVCTLATLGAATWTTFTMSSAQSLLLAALALGIPTSAIQTISSGTSGAISASARLVIVSTAAGPFTLTCAPINPGHAVLIWKSSNDANSLSLAPVSTELINQVNATMPLLGSTFANYPGWTLIDYAANARLVF